MEIKTVKLWGKDKEVQKATIISLPNIQFYCHKCKKEVHKEWKLERQFLYVYMVPCPICNRVEEVYF